MKRILLFILCFIFLSGSVLPTYATDSFLESAVDAVNDAVDQAGQAVQQAGESAAEALKPPTPSPIYTGEFFRRDESERYKLDGVVNTLLPGVARWIAGFLAAIAVLFLIYAGILFLTAGGEEEKISEATKTAVYVVIGLVLAMFGYVLVYLFLTLFSP